MRGLCGSNGLWDLPAEIQPGSAAFARGFSTTGPLDESSELLVIVVFVFTPQNFPGGSVAKTLCSQSRQPGFNPWSGN